MGRGSRIGLTSGGVLLVLAVLAAVVGVPLPDRALDFDAGLPPGTTQTHKTARLYPLTGKTTVPGLVIERNGIVTAQADRLTLDGYRLPRPRPRIAALALGGVTLGLHLSAD